MLRRHMGVVSACMYKSCPAMLEPKGLQTIATHLQNQLYYDNHTHQRPISIGRPSGFCWKAIAKTTYTGGREVQVGFGQRSDYQTITENPQNVGRFVGKNSGQRNALEIPRATTRRANVNG